MVADAKGNDINEVTIPVTGAIMLAPYNTANAIKANDIASSVKEPHVPAAYTAVGLIESGGGPHDARENSTAITFYQQGYSLTGNATLTLQFTVAENNPMVRRMTIGEPDSNGVYHVQDIMQSDKWMAYVEESYKDGRVRRRAGVVQLTANAPAASTSGSVTGQQVTLTWQRDDAYDGDAWIESWYEPTNHTPSDPSAHTGDNTGASTNGSPSNHS